MHRIKLAYASDFARSKLIWWVCSADKFQNNALIASLDHAMWFYGEVDATRWHLHDINLQHSQDERVLSTTRLVTLTFFLDGLVLLSYIIIIISHGENN